MSQRQKWGWGIALVLLGIAASAFAQERGALTVLTEDLKDNTAVAGWSFDIRADLNYQDVPSDKNVIVRLKALYESENTSINDVKNEIPACRTSGHTKCNGFLQARFHVHFEKEILPENWIQVDAYTLTRDGKSQHFLDTYILKVKMARVPLLQITRVDAPQPPETVRVGEPVPVRVQLKCSNLLPDSRIDGEIETVEGGSGYYTWKSKRLSGSSTFISEPIEVQPDRAGLWKLRATATTAYATAVPMEFELQAVEEATRILGPVNVSYPKPPDTVNQGEKVRFDVTMGYKNFPPGTVAAVVFGDPSTGEDLSEGWTVSRSLGGEGTYNFEGLTLHAPKVGTWNVNVMIRLPKLNAPEEYKTYWEQQATLTVVDKTASPPPVNTVVMAATITKIRRPQGTLQLNELFPIIVEINYSKLGESGTTLMAMVTEKGPGIFAGRADSILLKKNGTYTFPNITVKAAHSGDFTLQVKIYGPGGRILATKWFTLKVVD